MFPQKFSALSNEKRYLTQRFTRRCSTSRALFPSERGICWLCPPFPSALSLLQGSWGSIAVMHCQEHQHSPRCWAPPRHLPQIQQNPPSPPVPFPGTSHDLSTATPVVILLLLRELWRTSPFPAPLRVLEFKHPLLGTWCRGLLFTAIKFLG